MLYKVVLVLFAVGFAVLSMGCLTAGLPPSPRRLKHPTITAKPASPQNHCEPCGMPFYLPKPLLVISKNFHHINEHPYGLTSPAPIPGTFDDQFNYAKLNATSQVSHSMSRTTSDSGSSGAASMPAASSRPGAPGGPGPGTPPSELEVATVVGPSPLSPTPADTPIDSLAPITFFTYEMVFVPDLTQKYVLDVSGGAGEIRAALNIINGWQFTGLGPFYMKDSSTAQNLMAKGIAINLGLQGTADVISSVADLVEEAAPTGIIKAADLADYARSIKSLSQQETVDFTSIEAGVIERYAEIFVYEPYLGPDGMMQWRQIVGDYDPTMQQFLGHRFERTYLGTIRTTNDPNVTQSGAQAMQRMLQPIDGQPSDAPSPGEGARATPRDEDRRQNLSLVPSEGDRPQLYQDLINRTLDQPQPKEEKKGLFGLGLLDRAAGLFHAKKAAVDNRAVRIAQ